MPQVEVFESKDQSEPLFTAEMTFLPRVGEYLSKDQGGYFSYYNVVEVWHREDAASGSFLPCIRVELDD